MSYTEKLSGIIDNIYKKHNYTLDKEVKNVLLDTSQHKLLSAPAGGTKTTLTQLMVNLLKLDHMITTVKHNSKITDRRDKMITSIAQNRILCIVYNKHNTDDIEAVHSRFYHTLKSMKIFSSSPKDLNYAEPGVTATTLHSHSLDIIESNLLPLGLRNFTLAKEVNINSHFTAITNKVMAGSSIKVTDDLTQQIKKLYDLYVGLMLYKTPIDQPLTDSVQFELQLQKVAVPPKYLREIFESFDSRKATLKLSEYSDMLRLADKALENPIIRENYQKKFDIIVADEVQDFTPLMFSIYRSLVGEKTKTITVGDPDQSIYSFLGAQEGAIENFEKYMGYAPKVFHLSVNRRCRRETMPYALNVIESIPGRPARTIVTNKAEGKLDRIEYSTLEQQLVAIQRTLNERVSGTTAILFRNKNQSIMLSRYLYTQKIPANYINANNCMEHSLYRLFIDTITELFINKSQRGLSMMHRLVPMSKDKMNQFFDFDKKGQSSICTNSYLWHNLDFSPLYADSQKFFSHEKQFDFIKEVGREGQSVIASDCIPRLLDMFYQNFYAYLPDVKDDPYIDLVLDWAKQDLSVGYVLRTAIDNINKDIIKYMSSSRRIGRLNICTIHGTKGLEFNQVILNLEDDSNPTLINTLSAKAKQYQEDEENRLHYVAATRQIDYLLVLCNKVKPHRLADEKYFVSKTPLIEGAKFDSKSTVEFGEEQLITRTSSGRKNARRSMVLGE